MVGKIKKTKLPEVLVLMPEVFEDKRGFFFESFNQKDFLNLTKVDRNFVQDNHSKSKKNTLRGLHYQINKPQGKLVRVISGLIFDVAVDLRSSSLNFGKWFGIELSSQNKKQLWIPEGFAHGFLVMSDTAEVIYKTTDYWSPENEICIKWSDKDLGIDWPLRKPILSIKDQQGISFKDAPNFK